MDLLRDKSIVIRKKHTCYGCRVLLPKGSLVRLMVTVDGGEIYSDYWCPICEHMMDVHSKDLGNFNYGVEGTCGEFIDEYSDWYNDAKKDLELLEARREVSRLQTLLKIT